MSDCWSYLSKKFSIIPVRSDKLPLLKSWTEYQTRRPTKDEIKSWENQYQNPNWAIITGDISNTIVIDVDSKESWNRLQEMIPDSLMVPTCQTPNDGYHMYFEYASGLVSRANVQPGIDIKTNGGYVVAPPSVASYQKNGKHVSGQYKWLPGLSIDKVVPPPLPDILFDLLSQSIYQNTQTDHSPKFQKIGIGFVEGYRDQTIFHIANCLRRGGMPSENILDVLRFIGQHCSPPFDESAIRQKHKSAIERSEKSDVSLTAEIRNIVDEHEYNLTSNDILRYSNYAATPENRRKILTVLGRLCREGILERLPNQPGTYRKVKIECEAIDWTRCSTEFMPLWLPWGLDEVAGIQPGNIMIFAGAKDSGKTAAMMNIAKENRHLFKIHYFSSEMGGPEFKLRASKFLDITPDQWGIDLYERCENFADVIRPGVKNINIIDYLEVTKDFFLVGEEIRQIWNKLKGAICIIALQKGAGIELGTGGRFSLEKARLYLSMDYGKVKIVSCKNFRPGNPLGNPRGLEYHYKLLDGCRYHKTIGWHLPVT